MRAWAWLTLSRRALSREFGSRSEPQPVARPFACRLKAGLSRDAFYLPVGLSSHAVGLRMGLAEKEEGNCFSLGVF